MKTVALGLALALLASCRPIEPPSPDVDGGGADDCANMCATLIGLGCDREWGIDPEDGPCLDWCRAREADPRSPSLCPALVARATSCDEANRLSQCAD